MRTTLLRLALLGAAAALPAATAWAQAAPDANRPPTTVPPVTQSAPRADGVNQGTATAPAPRHDAATGAPAADRSTEGGNNAVRLDGGSRTGSLEAGANSFTEGQARSRLEAAGFTNVQNLRKDDGGIWRGIAMLDGRQVDVGLDYRGNVAPAAR